MFTAALNTRPARSKDRTRLDRFLTAARYLHTHLDWQPPLDWLGRQPFHLAFVGDTVVGALAAPPDPPGTSWIRLAAVGDKFAAESVLDTLWLSAYQSFGELKVSHVTCMLLDDWLRPHLERWVFEPLVDVVVLRRQGAAPKRPDLLALNGLRLRPAVALDLDAMAVVDNVSFAPPWQYSPAVLQHAMAESSLVTVAELDGKVVGYQISSGGTQGAHLARLAVMPELQGRGIGRALTVDMIDHFEKRGTSRITVNTQRNNTASLNVYRALGFEATGEYYGVWQHRRSA